MTAQLQNIYAPLPQMKRGAPMFPGYDAKSGNIVYTCGNAVVIRNIANPLTADMYYEHPCRTTVAKYSPSGYYIASGDIQGNIRIWDTTQKEHPLKLTIRALSGAVSDIAWSGDSQRVLVVGEGKERFGTVFVWDAGSSVGEISGHTKSLVSGDFKAARPFRLATGGEDSQINWFEGPPFKFKKSIRDHQRMVTCVRFAPDGAHFATCATDKKIAIYESKAAEKVAEFEGHKGGVYGLSWAPDSQRLMSCSADKSVAVWEVPSGRETARVMFGGEKAATEHQQLGCVWANNQLLSVNLEGEISYLDAAAPSAPTRVLSGHNKSIYGLATDGQAIFTGSYEGKIVRWNAATGETQNFSGKGHTNQIAKLVLRDGTLYSCAMDNTVRMTSIASATYADSVGLDSPVAGLVVSRLQNGLVIAATMQSVNVIRGAKLVSSLAIKYEATCISISPDEKEIAVGGKDDKTIHIYTLEGDALKEKSTINNSIRGALVDLEYSPDGKYLASTDASRNIFVWDAASKQLKIEGWIFHTAKVFSISWSADSLHLASGGLDGAVYVWSVQNPSEKIAIKNAHFGGVNTVAWLSSNVIISVGQDCALKSWQISF